MRFYLLAAFLLCFSATLSATVNTHIEPSTLTLGESFRLTLTLDEIQSAGIPDLMPLQRDFIIDATEHSVSTSVINGQAETVNQWTVILSPKQTGTLSIPALKIGQQHSSPSQINVTGEPSQTPSGPTSPAPSADPIQLITETSERAPYINQQILYTVKLFHQDPLLDANYQPPHLEDALLVSLGSSQGYQASKQGQRYTVEEQHYALFPQQSGPQTLVGPSFQAVVYDGTPKRVQAHAESTHLAVKPIPPSYLGKQWLPAKALSLTEHYDHSAKNLPEGSTLIRTITLEGVAIPAELLPAIAAKPHDAFGVYPEKPVLNNTIRGQDVIGTTTVQITYLLNQSGSITLPAYPITWFNTTTGQTEISSLPARTLHVTGTAHQKTSGVKPQQKQTLHSTPLAALKQPTHPRSRLPWIIATLFAIAWLTTLALFFKRKRAPSRAQKKRLIEKTLHEACISNHPANTRTAVLNWARFLWPNTPMAHLDDVITCIHNEDLNEQLTLLSKTLYSQTKHTTWHGGKLWQLIKADQQTPHKQKKKQTLAPLNPVP